MSTNLTYTIQGQGPTVVFLHGMVASGRYWDQLRLSITGHTTVAIDLLGFGKSPSPKDCAYRLTDHMDSIIQTLDRLGCSEPIVLVGHSMGAVIALALAVSYPHRVSKLVLIGTPIFKDASEAKLALVNSGILPKPLLYGKFAHLACSLMCNNAPLTKLFLPLWFRDFPKAVAQDINAHTWQSYSGSLQHVLIEHNVSSDLAKVTVPVELMVGDKDRFMTDYGRSVLQTLPPNVQVHQLAGSHQLIFEHPQEIIAAIG